MIALALWLAASFVTACTAGRMISFGTGTQP